ncbi:MAG: hypothetical protein MI919_05590, partial [Holophagales bacterium]|nr:hypothetical protein [Holophagales bacterium]
GHHLIRAQLPLRAVEVFTLCDRLFPETPGILVSLAYAHQKSGDASAAVALAQRVLATDPDEPDARRVLEEAGKH